MIVRYLVQYQNIVGDWCDCTLFCGDTALFSDAELAETFADNVEGFTRVITLVGNIP